MKKTTPKPLHNLLVRLKEPIATTISTKGGFTLHLAGEYRREWNVTCEGVVAGLPKENPYKGKLKEGDTLYFRYQVVSDREFKSDHDHFHPYIEENYKQVYYNSLMEKISIIAVQGVITIKWIGMFHDKNGNFLHGVHGTQSDLERWKSQFKFGTIQNYQFSNLIEYQDVAYWKCQYEQVFAKKTKNGLQALEDMVIMKPIDLDVPRETFENSNLLMPQTSIKARLTDRATLISGGEDIGYKKGDIVSYDERFLEKYTFDKEDYYLIHKDRLDGVYN